MQKKLEQLNDDELLDMIIEQTPNWRDLVSLLLQRHHAPLLARCFAYLRNHEDAEDAVQEAELRAFRAIRNFRRDASFRTWLFTIGDRQCHDLAKLRARHVLGEHTRSLIQIHQQDLMERHSRGQADATLTRVIDGLPRRDRDLLILRYYLDLSQQEISSYLGLGLSATKMRIYRALELVSALMLKEQRIG